jgi:hypothetical protein
MLEAQIQNLVRLEAAEKGIYLWRNNVGAVYARDGRLVRFGLANDSANVNLVIKSADLIGIRPVIITKEMIGQIIGQFISREIKKKDWRYSDSPHERAQLTWAELITSLGGDACFTNGVGTL